MSAIANYLEELSGLLARRHRRRVLAEVRAHLLDAAAAEEMRGADPDDAARHAVERFGTPTRVATQFNALPRRTRALAHRVAAMILASAAMGTLGTATVWAIEPGASASPVASHAASHPHLQTRPIARHR